LFLLGSAIGFGRGKDSAFITIADVDGSGKMTLLPFHEDNFQPDPQQVRRTVEIKKSEKYDNNSNKNLYYCESIHYHDRYEGVRISSRRRPHIVTV